VGSEQRPKELPVVRNLEVQQFVDGDLSAECGWLSQEVRVKCEATIA